MTSNRRHFHSEFLSHLRNSDVLLGQEVGDQLVGDGKEQAFEESRLLVSLFLVAHTMGTAQEHHLILADNAGLLAARQLYLAAKHHIKKVLFEEERTLVASRGNALVNDADAIENKRGGSVVACHHRRREFDNPVHLQTIYNLVCKGTQTFADQREFYLEIVFEFWL